MDSPREPIVLELIGRISPADVPLLCARLRQQAVTADGAETEADTESDAESDAESDTGGDTESDTGTGIDPDAGTDAAGEVICDAGGLTVADLTAVNAIARLRLTARRLGRCLRLRNAAPELLALLDFVGLGGDDPDRPAVLTPPG
ncbi:STAS domain-containing protein [Streptomyces formicae]|uniref:STAS domain-containing protein n=1 Tax=Streptomyces formicae TaxID=1616117 RepID=UPI001F586AF9|nr:STAS domain-containing protein [Streptomyces formicae]